MENLLGRSVVVLGGAGEVGEGICRILLRRGARVGVPSRSSERIATLRAGVDPATRSRLYTLVADACHPDRGESVRDHFVETLGEVDDVVVCLGSWWEGGPLLEVDLEEWTEKVSRDSLLVHLVAARTWLPGLLERGRGSFLLINGGTALHPTPGSGLVNIASAAQLMLKDVLVAENGDRGVRINSLVLTTPIFSRRLREGDPAWLDNDEVGRTVAHLLSDAGADRHGETIELSRHDQVPA